ncbi:hypothetical protein [Bdellovibrio sp. ArHS]|nr:hypothetical protein [Bdellovibrio sp. ArHS]
MAIFKFFIDRLFNSRPFFYGWEQRAFERRQEQYRGHSQNSCRAPWD